jgi:hypothetical protein
MIRRKGEIESDMLNNEPNNRTQSTRPALLWWWVEAVAAGPAIDPEPSAKQRGWEGETMADGELPGHLHTRQLGNGIWIG